ncbi:MAG: A/G-specific adenine glycosylase [Chloroherpetonaceae bacterium]|nr:A/G-specific adenine glycosylase [Chloroherpetonaceae bacterium]MDW8437540.1 A/G-specific adenine glycosylase [Chloroherpetonaceae bacterium]
MTYDKINSEKLLEWFSKNKRELPWRKTKNPYHIWISEVMLQQTQVATVIPYYERFLAQFPTIESLANADADALMKAWEGLGYYARARHLRQAAQTIMREHHGELPKTRKELRKLKGFGAYTSASVASIAFGEDCAAVDGNVLRVFARLYAIPDDLRSPAAKSKIEQLAALNLPKGNAGTYNEALMELGATICLPKNPKCSACPLNDECAAFRQEAVSEYPFKSKKPAVPREEIAVGIVLREGKALIALRPPNGLLGNLWEFPGGKRERGERLEDCCKREVEEETGLKVRVGKRIAVVKHAYSHFKITLHAFLCDWIEGEAQPKSSQEARWVSLDELDRYAFPKANKSVIEVLRRMDKAEPTLFGD